MTTERKEEAALHVLWSTMGLAVLGILVWAVGYNLHVPEYREVPVHATPWKHASALLTEHVYQEKYVPLPAWTSLVPEVEKAYGVHVTEDRFVVGSITGLGVVTIDTTMPEHERIEVLFHEVGHLYAYGRTTRDVELSAWIWARREFIRRGWAWSPDYALIALGSYYDR